MTPRETDTATARFRAVVDVEDDRDHHERLAAVGDLRAGRIVCTIKPDSSSLSSLSDAVLEGLGKNLDVSGASVSAEARWSRCAVWLRAEHHRELVVLRAQWLNPKAWDRLLALAAQTDCGLTLVISGTQLTPWQEKKLADWPFETMTFAQWQERYEAPWEQNPAPPRMDDSAFPPLPTDDFALFRWTCRELLAEKDFELVDKCWRRSWTAARDWVRSEPLVDEASVAAFLRDAVRTARSYGEVVTTLRGCQAAFFLAGWLVKVNDERLMGSALQQPYDLLTPASVDLLRTYVAPRYPAAATLVLVLREGPAALASLRCEDVGEDGMTVCWEGRKWSVPEDFAVFLRAQRYERALDGDSGRAQFFVSRAEAGAAKVGGKVQPSTPHSLQGTLRAVARETGLLVTTDFTASKASNEAVAWQHRRGVSVVPIPAPLQRASWRAV